MVTEPRLLDTLHQYVWPFAAVPDRIAFEGVDVRIRRSEPNQDWLIKYAHKYVLRYCLLLCMSIAVSCIDSDAKFAGYIAVMIMLRLIMVALEAFLFAIGAKKNRGLPKRKALNEVKRP